MPGIPVPGRKRQVGPWNSIATQSSHSGSPKSVRDPASKNEALSGAEGLFFFFPCRYKPFGKAQREKQSLPVVCRGPLRDCATSELCNRVQCGSWIPQKECCAGRWRNEWKASCFLPWGCPKDFPSSVLLVYLANRRMSRECSGTNT